MEMISEEMTTPLMLKVTISKDNTGMSSEERGLLLAGRDVDEGGGEEEEEEDGESDEGDEDDDEQDNSGEDREEENEENHERKKDEREDHLVVSQAVDQKVAKKRADVLQAQIHKKLESIPELGLSSDESPSRELIEYLTASLAKLSVENRMLKEALQAAKQSRPADDGDGVAKAPVTENMDQQKNPSDESWPEAPVFEEMHLVDCARSKTSWFRDVPRMFKGDLRSAHLRGRHGVENLSAYIKNHPKVTFALVHEYKCFCAGGKNYYRMVGHRDGRMLDDSRPAEAESNSVIYSQDIRAALQKIAAAHPSCFEGWEMSKLRLFSVEPHLLFYTHHKALLEFADSSNLSEFDSQSIKLICNWMCENKREDWGEADELFKRGKVTARHMNKLFRPGEVVVGQALGFLPGLTWAYEVAAYPWDTETVSILAWGFNGRFYKTKCVLDFSLMITQSSSLVDSEKGEFDIASLKWFPLRFSEPDLYDRLLARGNRFWSCRRKKIISCRNPNLDGENGNPGLVEDRLMVDYKMFKRMHPRNLIFRNEVDDLGSAAMNKKEPPNNHFLTLLPAEIHAFNLSTKTWRIIRVDRITDVTWNKDAFQRLVLPTETKELVQAAVMIQGHPLHASPDIVAGKGQGLLILLHGGPGTGKTLTAESIAESQERPLYRVTCGDIGIEPADVERYLETVFTLGKAWGCVVLLDEADVFLEERGTADQRQNAIVSIFLRLLEYYDGILILTTNRVGTFDEAFKSRIHLALHYDRLNEEQRVKIWRNLLSMLKDRTRDLAEGVEIGERVDMGDLFMNIDKLAREDLNGRQIRNVITLARSLAKFRGEMLVYKHVQDALASVVKFDRYLLGLRGADDEWAARQMVR